MLTITITDTNTERYTYTASANVLGRRYDNIAEYVSVVKPESEAGRDCIMIVTYGDTVVDHIPVGDTPIAITSNLSQYASVKIGFAFLGADGYIKNSEVKQFSFLPAQKPYGFVPLPPEQKTTVEYLLSHGFTGAKLENNILSFTNAAGAAVVEIKLSGFIQEQADWNETDTSAETYIKNKPTKLSEFTNDSGFVTGADISGKADKSYVDDELAKKQPVGDYATKTDLSDGLATKQPTGDYALKSELPDVSQFITKTVNDLVYYYTKTQVDNMVSAIPKFSIKVVDILPFDDISTTTIYLLKTLDSTNGDLYTEYIYVDGAWETLGTQTVDLSGYVTTEALNAAIADFVTEDYITTVLTNYVTTETFTGHTGNTNNPHGVTAAQVGAYVKPTEGIPESDLSEEVQNKLNNAPTNLLKQTIHIEADTHTSSGYSAKGRVYLDYNIPIDVTKNYIATIQYNGETYQSKASAYGGSSAAGESYMFTFDSPPFNINNYLDIINGQPTPDSVCSVMFSTSNTLDSVPFWELDLLSIVEATEVVADKVKNKLTITVNGEATEYDGSGAVDVNIDTSGGDTGDNVLQADVSFTSMAAVLDYALNLEIGKLYKLTWTFNGTSYSQTTYCWKSSTNMTMLGTMDSGGGGEAILINPDNADDGTIIIMDKMYANPATEESYPSENNATILVIQNYANLIIQSIKEVGTYTPPIPIPTSADNNKILQVQGTQYTLIDLPAGTQSLYRHDVQIMSIDGSNRPAFAQCVILDYSPGTYNYEKLFSLIQKMLVITAVGTVVVERSDGKKTQGNVVGISYDSEDGKIKIMSTYLDSDTSTSISQNSFEMPSNYQIYDYVTKIE